MVRERRSNEWGLLYKALHKMYRHAYETPKRQRIAARVAAFPPSRPVDRNTPFTVHMLVCNRDFLMALCTAKMANLAFDMPLPWFFHDDGSLTDEDVRRFEEHLPGCRVVRRPEADRFAEERLANYPGILEYRRNQVMALKLIDVKLWSSTDRLAYIDSDVLFFDRPEFMLDALNGIYPKNYFNKDIADGYVRSADEIARSIGVRPHSRLNAGLWVMWREVIDLDTIESWLAHPSFSDNLYAYTLDQTFISMLAASSRNGVDYMPETYDVKFRKDVRQSVNKHYVGRIRYGYELEGLDYLLDELDAQGRWNAFVSTISARHRTVAEVQAATS